MRRSVGLLSFFARHPTAGNLLMAVMILSGVVALTKLNRQFFPDFTVDVVQVSVEWSGATAEDVEQSIVQAIEPEVRFIDDVKQVTSAAREGAGTVYVEFLPGADMQRALSEVESAVATLTTLPESSERPRITRIVPYDTIRRLVLSGDVDEAALKILAKRMRDELLDRGVDKVTLFGARDEEIHVDIDPRTLRRLDLTLQDVADAIAARSQDLPAGDLSGPIEAQPRALGLAETAEEVAALEVLATPSGRRVRVGDIAEVGEAFDPDDAEALRHGRTAIELHVQRALTADALTVQDIVNAYVAEARTRLPDGIELETFDDFAILIRDRISLLVKNGLGGLILVLAILFLFLDSRSAFWVAVGIPTALMAMLGILWLAGLTLNMISLFAMILALGIVVDDAIVVGEHAVSLREQGVPAAAAAEQGAVRMLGPVTSATLTTIAAFVPLLLVRDIIGTIIREIPFVVSIVLLASLIECFLVLPAHMRVALANPKPPARLRRAFNEGFERLRHGPFRRLVATAIEWRYVTVAAAVALLLISTGLLAGGRVGFVFFPSPESDTVFANLTMAPGTSRERTVEVLGEVDAALTRAERRLTGDEGGLVRMALGQVGKNVVRDEGAGRQFGDNLGGIHVELISSDLRAVRTAELQEAWRAEIPPIPGVESLSLTERSGGPPGRELDIRLEGGASTEDLKRAALEVHALLARVPGVSEVEDDLPYGKQEIIVRLTPRGRALGLTTGSLGNQLRDGFEGALAKRFPRGDEEVDVRVRLVEEARTAFGFEDYLLRTPQGTEVALGEVATLEDERGFASILREDGRRRVAITGELDEATVRLEQVVDALGPQLAEIAERYGLVSRFAGKAEEQADTFADMKLGALVALVSIYIVLAWIFASFTRPFAVMIVIPFGLIGAIWGHLALGYDLSFLSLVALLGLSGILVNDSIVLVTAIQRRLAEGMDLASAIVDGTTSRLRAVILTSATTIGGLLPLMFETSLQARFLIPMAVTISFGLAVNTFLVLLLVPAVLAIQGDAARLTRARPATGPATAEA